MFAIVEFGKLVGNRLVSNNEMAVVPLQWLRDKEENCYWLNKTAGLSKIVENVIPFKISWNFYPIYKVHFKTGSYVTAMSKLSSVIEAYSVSEVLDNSVTENAPSSNLTLKVNERHSSETCDADNDLANNDLLVNDFADEVIPNKRVKIADAIANEVSEDVLTETVSIASTVSSCFSSASRSNFNNSIVATLQSIKSEVQNHSVILNKILRTNRKLDAPKLIPPSDLPSFPIKDNETFVDFDNTLSAVSGTYDYIVEKLACVGGLNIQATTRRILRFALSNEVAVLYNWKGRNKLSFEKTRFMAVVYDAAKLNYPIEDKSDHQIETSVKEWLKFAKARLSRGGKEKQ